MSPILKKILATLGGILVAALVVAIVESPGYIIHPLPEGVDIHDAEAIRKHAAAAPFAAQVFVPVAWLLGTLAGVALVVAILGKGGDALWPGAIIAALILLGAVYNLVTIPSPIWMWITGIAAPLVGFGLAIFFFGRRSDGAAGSPPSDTP